MAAFPNFRGQWLVGTTYIANDVVNNNGSSWTAIGAGSTGVAPVEGAVWTLLAGKGDTGAAGANGTNGTNGADGADGTLAQVALVTDTTDADGLISVSFSSAISEVLVSLAEIPSEHVILSAYLDTSDVTDKTAIVEVRRSNEFGGELLPADVEVTFTIVGLS